MMDYKTAAKQIGQGQIQPVYVCYGPEKYMMQEFINHLAGTLVDPDHTELAVSKFDLAETPLEIVLEDAGTLPFLVPRKLVIAQGAYFFTGAREKSKVEHRTELLLDYLNSPADTAVLLFIVSADKLDERKKLVKTLRKIDAAISFPMLKPEELSRWIIKQGEKAGCTFAVDGVERLIMNCGTQLQSLSMEIDKLALYASGGEVTSETVEKLVIPSTEQNVFLMIEEMVQLRLDKAFAIFYELLKQKEEPIKIMMLMARQFRILLQVKELSRIGCSQQQMASRLGLHPYAVKLAIDQGKKYSEKKLAEIISSLSELDYQMKSGQMDKVLGLEMFLLKLAG